MKYIKTFENYDKPFNLDGMLTNIKYRLNDPSKIMDYVDIDGDVTYIKIPADNIKSLNDAETIVSMANSYNGVKNAYYDGDTKSIMIQASNH